MKIVKEARKARQASIAAQQPSSNSSSENANADENKNSNNNNNNNNNGAENAHADDKKSSNVNDNAERICWTCHKELVCLKKNICAGCFKVCHYILFFIQNDQLNVAGSLL